MKTILITGGGGFIGSNLAQALLSRGSHNVVICDRFGDDEKWRNLAHALVFDIIPPEQLFEWLEVNRQEIELVYHLGAISSTTEKDADLVLKNNFALSLKMWRWCNARNVRLVYASSSATYGDGGQGFNDTMDLAYLRTLTPLSLYGWSKHLFDVHVATQVARGEAGLPQWVGLKFFNAYGPNEAHKGEQQSVISKMAQHAVKGGSVRLFRSYRPDYPDGGQKRDMIYIKDCLRVLEWCLDNPQVSGLFNLGSGKAGTFNDMATALFAALNRPPSIHYMDMPDTLATHYQYFTEANMQKLKAAGYSAPFTPVEEGIKDYVQGYLLKG